MLDRQRVGATSLNAFENGLGKFRKSERPRWASAWIDPLSPRSLWLVGPAGEAIQGELVIQGEF